jgi:4,5-DOPA dioxygenase extradiol
MSAKMPTLFVGHGSPMNAVEENEFTQGWREIAESIPTPNAILCVSAHWFIPSTKVTAMERPKTIYDFYGFPPALYEQQYPAPGAPDLAKTISESIKDISITPDQSWGLDHGTWVVLKQMYPDANIPTLQLSIDYTKPPRFHFELGKRLAFLREQGVLIIGSGNLVHNLLAVDWHNPGSIHKYALEFENVVLSALNQKDTEMLTDFPNLQDLVKRAHPTLDHYFPLLYAKGAAGSDWTFDIQNQKIILGSISMTCFKFG